MLEQVNLTNIAKYWPFHELTVKEGDLCFVFAQSLQEDRFETKEIPLKIFRIQDTRISRYFICSFICRYTSTSLRVIYPDSVLRLSNQFNDLIY